QVRVFDFGLFASASWLADATSRRIIGKLLELLQAVFDGLRVASKDLRHVPDAAMSEFDRFECGKASAILFGQALVILTQKLFDFWAVGLLKVKRHAGSSSRQILQGMGDPTLEVLRSRRKNASRNEAGHYFGTMPKEWYRPWRGIGRTLSEHLARSPPSC